MGSHVLWRTGERGFVLATANRASQGFRIYPRVELAAAIDLALSCDRARGRGGACAGGFSAPNRVDPIIRRYLSWTVLGKRAMGAG